MIVNLVLTFILGQFGLPAALAPKILAGWKLAKEAYDIVKARGGSEAEAMAAADQVLSGLSSYREGPDSKKTEDSIKKGEPFNV